MTGIRTRELACPRHGDELHASDVDIGERRVEHVPVHYLDALPRLNRFTANPRYDVSYISQDVRNLAK